jgi:type I restriction enzyme S subunit
MNIEIKKIIKKINKGEVPRGYKKTKVGIIPNEWPYDRFKNIVKKSQYGLSLAKNIKGNIKILDMPHLQNGHIINKDLGYVSITPDEYENYVIKKGDFLFNRTNSYDLVGKSAVAEKDYKFVFASYLVRFKVKEECNFQYIGEWFALSHKTNSIKRLITKGVSQCNINPTELQRYFYIPLPPLPEQEKIAEILTICDEVIELKEKLIEQKKLRKKFLLQALLVPESPNFRRLTGFNDEWKEVKLARCLLVRKEKHHKTKEFELHSLTIENGVTSKTDRYNREFLVRSNDKKYKIAYINDIVYNPPNLRYGAIALNKIKKPVLLSPTYEILYAKRNIDISFLSQLLTSKRQVNIFATKAEGTLIERMAVKVNIFLNTKIQIPCLPEQKAIANVLSVEDKEINLLEKELEQQKLKKKALMQLLLTGKVRVNVS